MRGDGAATPTVVNKTRFLAYIAYKCWRHREALFRKLVEAAKEHGLGDADALSICDGAVGIRTERREERGDGEALRLRGEGGPLDGVERRYC